MLGVGEVLPFAPTRRRAASLPVDVARTIEETLANVPVDLVHVHEPFAPSASSVALRHSRALNVGSFHAPTERVLSTQLTAAAFAAAVQPARRAHRELPRDPRPAAGLLPRRLRVILPGADRGAADARLGRRSRLLAFADEERAALRDFLRALRALPAELEWRATGLVARPLAAPATLGGRARRARRGSSSPTSRTGEALAERGLVVLASEGLRPAPGDARAGALRPATAASPRGCPCTRSCCATGSTGSQFEPGDVQTLTAHLAG